MQEENKTEDISYNESYLKYNNGDFDVMPNELRVPPWRGSSNSTGKKTSFNFKEDLYISIVGALISKMPTDLDNDIANIARTAQKIINECFKEYTK